MATIGRASAVADFGWLRLHGYLGWLAWLFVHILNLIGFRNRLVVLVQWAWSYFSYQRAIRLITGPLQGHNPTRQRDETRARGADPRCAGRRARPDPAAPGRKPLLQGHLSGVAVPHYSADEPVADRAGRPRGARHRHLFHDCFCPAIARPRPGCRSPVRRGQHDYADGVHRVVVLRAVGCELPSRTARRENRLRQASHHARGRRAAGELRSARGEQPVRGSP